MKLKVLDLFSGIGMFSYGLEKTGLYETVLFCEQNDKCQKVLKKHWPEIYCYSDVTKLTYCRGSFYSEEDEFTKTTEVDVIVGGFPCQDLSLANPKGKGLEGDRSGLWKEYKRLILEVKPRGVIIENVSALLNRGLTTILQDLNSLGYDAEWHCITAKAFGAPHERDRLFVLAYSRSLRIKRLYALQHHEEVRSWRESWKETLQQIYNNPFERSDSYPKPLLCRMDVTGAGRVDRLKQLGNTVYWPIVYKLGQHIYQNINQLNETS